MHNFSNNIVGPGPGALLIYMFDCTATSTVGLHMLILERKVLTVEYIIITSN